MSGEYTYKEYTSDESLYKRYSQYQRRYADNIREGDKVLIQMIAEICHEMNNGGLSLLDIGCSTGNLLCHIKRAFPRLTLTGGDLMARAIEECRKNPNLADVDLQLMDIFAIPATKPFDIIVANAVLYLLDNKQFDMVMGSVTHALKPGGWFLIFDFFHEFRQDLQIIETSRSHPDGLTLYFRSQTSAKKIIAEHGFSALEFRPFQISMDLPMGVTYGDNTDGFEDLNSYTVKTETDKRLLFRGALFQPWCHFRARKVK